MKIPLKSELILKQCAENRVLPEIVNIGVADQLREALIDKYTNSEFSKWKNHKITWIWSALVENSYVSVQDSDPYQDLDEFLLGREFILFFNYFEDHSVFKFPEGTRISLLTSSDYLKEFYVSDVDLKFLLCYNHEQFLLGCGEAQDWMSSYY